MARARLRLAAFGNYCLPLASRRSSGADVPEGVEHFSPTQILNPWQACHLCVVLHVQLSSNALGVGVAALQAAAVTAVWTGLACTC